MVNPYDINGMKATIVEAAQAEPKEISRRMKAMRKQILEHDVDQWAAGFLEALASVPGAHGKSARAPSDG